MKRFAAFALAATVLASGCRDAPSLPRLEWMPEMVDSMACESFAATGCPGPSPAMRAPPPGTLARDAHRFAFGAGPREAARAGRELANPVKSDAAALARGGLVFQGLCAVCHGGSGKGDGPLIPRHPAPPALNAAHARSLPDGEIFHAITLGRGLMPALAGQLTSDDRWRAVHHLRALQAGAEIDAP